ncbi:MAG: heme exporter protein CcmB [Caulobacter sp.]|nr:heme exporter protein CcmB [Caulobacter sp.]
MNPLAVLLRRELALAWGRGGGPLPALAFYAGVTTLLPLAIGPEPEKLAVIAPGIAWLCLALASLLSLERVFERDHEDGALDLLALGGPPLEAICAIKALAQWLSTGLPLAFAAPVAALMLGAPVGLAPVVFLCALIGGLAFAFVGGLGAALALGSRRGGLLIAVIVLPLFAPPVIFGGGALSQAAMGAGQVSGLLLLCGWALAAVALSPLAMAAACRNALD